MIKSDPQNPDFCHSVFEFDDQTIGRSDFFSEPDNKSDDIIKSRTSFFATKKTFLKIQQEWKKKPSFFLKREKHSKQKYYSILFSKTFTPKLSRIKKRSMIYQMSTDLENCCSGICFEDISVLYAKIADIKFELEKYKNLFGVLKDNMEISDKVKIFTRVVSYLKLEFEPRSVRASFYKIAQNLQEVDYIRACSKKISSDVSSMYTERKSKMIDIVKSNRYDVFKVFGCVNGLEKNSIYVMDLFGKCALRHLDNNMALYWNNLVDLKLYKVSMVHVDGRFYSSPSGWKQSFEIVAILENESMIKSVSVGFALLSSSTQENYSLLFKKIRDHKYLNIKSIMLDFEIAIYNAVKFNFPNSSPRGCYYHYRNNLNNRSTKIKRWLNKSPSKFVMNVLSLAPFVNNPIELLYTAIENIDYGNKELFKNPDFKMIMYVYETYILKLKSFFKINLELDMIRTNNACEGRNSVLKRHFSFKPNIEDLIDFIAIRFKKDAVKKFTQVPAPSSYDIFLIEIQKSSENINLIVEFCKISNYVCNRFSEELLDAFQRLKYSQLTNPIKSIDDFVKKMNELKIEYHKFKLDMKQKYEVAKVKMKEYKEFEEELQIETDISKSIISKSDVTGLDILDNCDFFGVFNQDYKMQNISDLFVNELTRLRIVSQKLVNLKKNISIAEVKSIVEELCHQSQEFLDYLNYNQ